MKKRKIAFIIPFCILFVFLLALLGYLFLCGWNNTTYNGNGEFFENGGGIEINGWTIAAAALTIFGAMYGVPIEAY